jgi:cytochrome b pre-mRNA-processing protein 3
LTWFLSRKPRIGSAHYALYEAIVAQSRQTHFYADWGVPDTVTGRFDMISLHMALVLRRLKREGPAVSEFSQALFDLFFKDMDRSLREMGVGDISVPKRIEKMGGLFYGLVDGLGDALESEDDGALDAFVLRNFLPAEQAGKAGAFAAYLTRQIAWLDALPGDGILKGSLTWDETA